MDTPSAPLYDAFLHELAKRLVPLIVIELKHQTNAEGMGLIALDPNNLALPVHSLLTEDDNTKNAIRGIVEVYVDSHLQSLSRKIDELDSKFDDLDTKVDGHDDRLDEIESNDTPVDSDNTDFQDAVMSVLRKSI